MRLRNLHLPVVGLLGLAARTANGLSDEVPDFVTGAYIIEFPDGHHDEDALFRQIRGQGLAVTKRMSFDYPLFKGVSIQIDAQTEGDPVESPLILQSVIEEAPLVKNIWPVRVITQPVLPPIENGTSPNLSADAVSKLHRRQSSPGDGPVGGGTDYPPHAMTQVDKLHAEGITGKGIKIAIVDSGVDYNHPALGGCFGKGCLFSFGYDFVGDDFLNSTSVPRPDDDPLGLCNGHGTHVAGILGAQENPYNFTGVAYGATFGAYRITACDGSTTNELLIKGYLRAHADGVDIISVSIRGLSGWNEDPTAVVAQRIVEDGTVFVAGSGNDATTFHAMFSVGAAATGLGVTSVGSVRTQGEPILVEVGSYDSSEGSNGSFVYKFGIPVFSQSFTRPVWLVTPDRATGGGEWEICGPLPDDTPDLSEYIVLVEVEGPCGDSWSTSDYLKEKGADYVMFYYSKPNKVPEPFCGDLRGCGMVPRAQGVAWRELIQAGAELELSITGYGDSDKTYRYFDNSDYGGGLVDDFSSWGPTWELDAKIDVLGVGGLVLSTYPTTDGNYSIQQGTSMSTPQISGIYALLMEATKIKDPRKLRSLLQSTAAQKPWANPRVTNPADIVQALAPVPQQGAGLAQAYDAAHAPVVISPSSISFNDSDAFVDTASFSIENLGSEDVTYTIGHSPALTVYTFKVNATKPALAPFPVAKGSFAALDFSSKSITVPGGGKAEFKVSPTPPTGLNEKQLPVYSGYITLNSTSGPDSSLVIPYLGVVGSIKSDTTPLVEKEVILGSYNTKQAQPANTTFQSPSNVPMVNFTTQVGTPFFRLDVVPRFETVDEVPTAVVDGVAIAGNIFTYALSPWWTWSEPWNGTVTLDDQSSSDLPAGSYSFLVRALRIRGRREDKDDWVAVQSDPFRLEYD